MPNFFSRYRDKCDNMSDQTAWALVMSFVSLVAFGAIATVAIGEIVKSENQQAGSSTQPPSYHDIAAAKFPPALTIAMALLLLVAAGMAAWFANQARVARKARRRQLCEILAPALELEANDRFPVNNDYQLNDAADALVGHGAPAANNLFFNNGQQPQEDADSLAEEHNVPEAREAGPTTLDLVGGRLPLQSP